MVEGGAENGEGGAENGANRQISSRAFDRHQNLSMERDFSAILGLAARACPSLNSSVPSIK